MPNISRKKPTATSRTSSTRTAAPVKKRTAPAPAPAKKQVTRKPVAQKAAAPVRQKAAPAPAKKTAPAAPAKRPVAAKPVAPAVTKTPAVSAFDLARAEKAVRVAQQNYENLHAAFWASQDAAVTGAVEHAAKMAEKEVPKKTGRPATKEGARKALAPEPKVIDEYFDIDEVKAMGITDLRELAGRLADEGIITERKIKGEIYAQMEAAGLFREDGSADADEDAEDVDADGEEDEEDLDEYEDDETEDAEASDDDADDEDDDGGDDDDSYTVADLEGMSLKELRALCEKWGIPWKGLSQADLVAAIVEAGSGDDEDEEEDEQDEDEETPVDEDDEEEEDDEDEDEEDDGDGLMLSIEEIEAMNATQLLEILGKAGVRVPAKSKNNADALRELLLSALEEQEDEDDEEE